MVCDFEPTLTSALWRSCLFRWDVIFLDSCKLFHHCPFLLPHGEDVQKVLEQWKEYKMGVPTYGAIILDESLENVSCFCTFIHRIILLHIFQSLYKHFWFITTWLIFPFLFIIKKKKKTQDVRNQDYPYKAGFVLYLSFFSTNPMKRHNPPFNRVCLA